MDITEVGLKSQLISVRVQVIEALQKMLDNEFKDLSDCVQEFQEILEKDSK